MSCRNSNHKNKANLKRIAADWVIENEIGLTPEKQDYFNSWLTEDPDHRKAYLEANRSWEELDRLLGLNTSYKAPVDPDLLEDNRKVYGLIRKKAWWISALCAVAAVAFVVIMPLGGELFRAGKPARPEEVVFERIKKLELPDGSIVHLNHGATINQKYSKEERLIQLVSGEANFEVKKDPSKPFVVEVSGIRIRAVGTEFNVRLVENAVDVIVTEGIVSLDTGLESSDNGDGDKLLEANSKATVLFGEDKMEVNYEQLDETSLTAEIAWKPTLINFNNTPLSQIIEEFNRRTPHRLVLSDPMLEDVRLTSYFWSDNVEGFLRLIESKYGVRVIKTDTEEFHLYRPL